jgi:hypothetical protein
MSNSHFLEHNHTYVDWKRQLGFRPPGQHYFRRNSRKIKVDQIVSVDTLFDAKSRPEFKNRKTEVVGPPAKE